MEAIISYIPNPKQNEFHGSNAFETLFVGGRGASKTWAGVMEGYNLSIEYPGNVGLMVRKQQTNLISTTLTTFRKIIPAACYHENEQKHTIDIFTGKEYNSTIFYAGLDDQESIKKYRGMELGWILFDQAEECSEEDISELIPCLRHKLPDGSLPHYRVMYLANPQQSYILSKFTETLTNNMQMIQVSTFDNPDRRAGYTDMLAELYKTRPEMYKAMVLGDIDIADNPKCVIPYSKIEAAAKRREKLAFFDKRIVSIDVAREGDDMTKIKGWDGCKIITPKDPLLYSYGKKDLDVTASRAVQLQKEIGANCIIWDADGIGGGLMSHLKHLVPKGTMLIEFHGSGASDDPRYANQRAQAWFETADLFNADLISIPNDPILKSQLASLHFEYKLGKLIVEDKKKAKELRSRSPDDADCVVYGVYGLKRAPSIHEQAPTAKGSMKELIEMMDDADYEDGEGIGSHAASKW